MADNKTTTPAPDATPDVIPAENVVPQPATATDLSDLKGRVNDLEGQVKTLVNDFQTFVKDVRSGNFVGAIVSAEQFKAAVSDVLAEANDDAKEVKQTVAANAQHIVSLENDLSAVRNDVAGALSDIAHFRLNRLGADANKVMSDVTTTEVDSAELAARTLGR